MCTSLTVHQPSFTCRWTNGLIVSSPDIQAAGERLTAVRGKKRSSDSLIEHRWLMVDQNVQGHDGCEAVVRQSGFPFKESRELLKIDFRSLFDLDLE